VAAETAITSAKKKIAEWQAYIKKERAKLKEAGPKSKLSTEDRKKQKLLAQEVALHGSVYLIKNGLAYHMRPFELHSRSKGRVVIGPLIVRVTGWRIDGRSPEIRIVGDGGAYRSEGGYPHPHVFGDTRVCWGNAEHLLRQSHAQSPLELLSFIATFLKSGYNDTGGYIRHFAGIQSATSWSCPTCGGHHNRGETCTYQCLRCGCRSRSCGSCEEFQK
jgi:hypothetical protein